MYIFKKKKFRLEGNAEGWSNLPIFLTLEHVSYINLLTTDLFSENPINLSTSLYILIREGMFREPEALKPV